MEAMRARCSTGDRFICCGYKRGDREPLGARYLLVIDGKVFAFGAKGNARHAVVEHVVT